MKESIGQTFVTNLILLFTGIGLLLLFYSVNYSRAYKAKNRIIYILEKNESFDAAKYEIDNNLEKASYISVNDNNFDYCKKYGDMDKNIYPKKYTNKNEKFYKYCVFEYEASYGKYYKVITFMKFEIPLIQGILEFPVRGETKNMMNTVE